MPTLFRLGAPGYSKALFTAENLGKVMERAHQTLDQTRGPLSIRLNTSAHDGVLELRRTGPSPVATAWFSHNLNAPPTTIIPEWVGKAVEHLASLREVHTVGFEPAGRQA